MTIHKNKCSAHPILIAGATASGKSKLANRLALETGGVIVNADSMQVYACLSILTARPSSADMGKVPHELYGFLPCEKSYNVGQYIADIKPLLAKYSERQLIIVGGTGLYFSALTKGIADIPEIDPAIREGLIGEEKDKGLDAFYKELLHSDPALAKKINPHDRQRILRGVEVFRATNEPLSFWQSKPPLPPLLAHSHKILLTPERGTLYENINQRFENMLAGGAVKEVEKLLACELPPHAAIYKALGVGEIAAYCNGERSLEEASAQAKQAIRRYAKRQMTWFRNQMKDWYSITAQENNKKIQEILSKIT